MKVWNLSDIFVSSFCSSLDVGSNAQESLWEGGMPTVASNILYCLLMKLVVSF